MPQITRYDADAASVADGSSSDLLDLLLRTVRKAVSSWTCIFASRRVAQRVTSQPYRVYGTDLLIVVVVYVDFDRLPAAYGFVGHRVRMFQRRASPFATPPDAGLRPRLHHRIAFIIPLVATVSCGGSSLTLGVAGCGLALLLIVFGAGVAVCAHRFDKVYRDAQKIVIEQHSNDLRGLTDESTEMAREAARAIEAARAALTDLRCQFIEIQKGR